MRNITWCLLGLGLLGMAGCAAAPPAAGTQFDGSYIGTNVVTRGGTTYCGPDGPLTVVVSGGRFNYVFPVTWENPVVIPTEIHQDGSLSGKAQYADSNYAFYGVRVVWVTVLGHVVNGVLDANVESISCTRHLSLRRG